MTASRRLFMTGGMRCCAGVGLTALGADQVRAETAAADPAGEPKTFELHPVGTVEKADNRMCIRIFEPFVDGLLGLQEWSHINVFYWFDQNDVPQKRRILQVHPQGNPANPR